MLYRENVGWIATAVVPNLDAIAIVVLGRSVAPHSAAELVPVLLGGLVDALRSATDENGVRLRGIEGVKKIGDCLKVCAYSVAYAGDTFLRNKTSGELPVAHLSHAPVQLPVCQHSESQRRTRPTW